MRKSLIGLSLLAAIAATGAQAQTAAVPPATGGMDRGLMGIRPDADGNITRTAALAAADQRFAAMDANHDGTVTPEEMRAYHAQRRAEWQRRHPGGDRPDRRAPQPVTADAFRARAAAMFDRLDSNHDGKIDAAERAAAPRFGPHAHHRRMSGPAPDAQPTPKGE